MEYRIFPPQGPLDLTITETMVPAPDGKGLYTICITPAGAAEKLPIVLIRSPYVNQDPDFAWTAREYTAFLRAGYAVIFQHCRGCGRSEGDCDPYRNEREDGLATLAWIRTLPEYDHQIYLYGGSYLSSVHFAYLDTGPEDVAGAVLPVQEVNRYNICYRNGFFKSGLHGGWATTMHRKKAIPRKNYTAETFRTLPLTGISRTIFGETIPSFDEVLRHPWPEDPYYQTPEGGVHFLHALDKLNIPILLITGFYDIYTEGVLQMFDTMRPELKQKSALVVTPYDHGFEGKGKLLDFPRSHLSEEWPDYAVNWFNAIRQKEPLQFVTPGCVTWYEQFSGKWKTAPALEEGPIPKEFYLADGKLLSEPPTEPPADRTYLYNPFAPATFNGGCCLTFGGMQLQDAPGSRYDILNFISAPLTEDMILQGSMKLEMQVKSDRPDTCFYARVSIIRNGEACGMRDEIVSLKRLVPDYQPGEMAQITMTFTRNAVRFAAGDAIRLDISSSCWPHYIPHTNRVGLFSEQTGADIAHNTVICNGAKLTLNTIFS